MARFLFISRHPIATSLATYKWSGTGIYSLVHHWCHSHELLMSDIGGLQHALHISFESLTGRTRETLALIEEFLRLRPHDYRYHLDERGNQRYFLYRPHNKDSHFFSTSLGAVTSSPSLPTSSIILIVQDIYPLCRSEMSIVCEKSPLWDLRSVIPLMLSNPPPPPL